MWRQHGGQRVQMLACSGCDAMPLAFSYSSLNRSSCTSPASCASTCSGVAARARHGARPAWSRRLCSQASRSGSAARTSLWYGPEPTTVTQVQATERLHLPPAATAAPPHLLETQLNAVVGLAALPRGSRLLLGVLPLHPGQRLGVHGGEARSQQPRGRRMDGGGDLRGAGDQSRAEEISGSANEARNSPGPGDDASEAAAAGHHHGRSAL